MRTITITWSHVNEYNVKHSVTITGPDAESVSEQLIDTLILDENVASGFSIVYDGKDVTTYALLNLIISALEQREAE